MSRHVRKFIQLKFTQVIALVSIHYKLNSHASQCCKFISKLAEVRYILYT